jgi:ribosomal protein S28E/S33
MQLPSLSGVEESKKDVVVHLVTPTGSMQSSTPMRVKLQVRRSGRKICRNKRG